jgi:ubiquinone/menaquinone biosynthesis C-methylase UbiE/chorismate mutase
MPRLDPLNDDPLLVLKEIGDDLQVTDLHFVGLLAKRLLLAYQVGFAKHRMVSPDKPLGANIYRKEMEEKRLGEVRDEAIRLGIDPTFAVGLVSAIINESCKRQMIQREDEDFSYGEVDYQQLRGNLLELTSLVAKEYDGGYDKAYPATHAYLEFETEVLGEQMVAAPGKRKALDLGCATGQMSFKLAAHFQEVVAVDISPAMLTELGKKAETKGVTNVDTLIGDVEEAEVWEHIPDNSIDIVTMGMGTASDIRSIRQVIGEIERVLVPQGRFLLSFYNADALLYKVGYFPWPESLAAVVDPTRHCLDVQFRDKTYSVYARPYTYDELEQLFTRHLQVVQRYTYPTFAAILPHEMLFAEEARTLVTELDRNRARLEGSDDGAYIITTGTKG